jgi:small-conductance mechanosensitive channel
MMNYSLFKIGPYSVCLINLIILTVIVFLAIAARRLIHRMLKKYLLGANVQLNGRRVTWLRLLSQSVYILAFYVAVRSFSINNNRVSFIDFLETDFIKTKIFTVSFYQIAIIIGLWFGAKIIINLYTLYITRRFALLEDKRGSEYVYIQIAKYITYIFVIFSSLKALDVNLSFFLTGSAALLVGLGLGLQEIFKDIFSGIVLLFEGVLKVGDIIELRDSSTGIPLVCKILKINVRTTQIETKDNNILIIPNAKLTQEYVENYSIENGFSIFKIDVLVAYGTDGMIVSDLLKQVANSHPKVLKSQEVEVRLNHFAQDGLQLSLLFCADNSWEIERYKSEIRFEIDRVFRKYHIEIPYPQRVMHLREHA